jgi:hypothetical protein
MLNVRKLTVIGSILSLLGTSCRDSEVEAPSAGTSLVLRDARSVEHRILVKDPTIKATVVVFLMTDCPVANAMVPDLVAMASHYGPLGVRFYGVFAGESEEAILKHSESYRIPFPCLLDNSCQLAGMVGASRVPEAAILSADGAPVYCGRIDDRAVKTGRIKPQPSERNLSDALDALLAGRNLPPAKQATAGCFITKPSR